MRWIVMILIGLLPIMGFAEDKTALEQDGFKVEVLENQTPKAFVLNKGVSHLNVPSPDTTVFRLSNNTNERVQVLFTFNRINPMNGRIAVLGDNGFVLDPKQVLVISEGRLSKRKKDKAVGLFAKHPEGFFHFAVFKERTDYPLILPTMTPPPYSAEHFVVDNGVRRWVPPSRYPFRRLQERPNYAFYATYGR